MMDAFEFLKTAERRYKSNPHDYANYIQLCGNDFGAYADELEKWSKEHPIKTRQSEFLKMFPNARIESDGMPSICPIVVDKRCHNKDDDALFCLVRDEEECRKCRRDYWLQEVQ
jgi:hypothetical protein